MDINKLEKQLNKMFENIIDKLEDTMDESLDLVKNTAEELVPVKTRKLKESIKKEIIKDDEGITGVVKAGGSEAPYAPYVEFGTGQRGEASHIESKEEFDIDYDSEWVGMAAQPFMYPAMKINKEKIKGNLINDIKMEIRKGV